MDIYLPLELDSAYFVSYYIYAPSGKSAYINIQGDLAQAKTWAFEIVFSTDGEVRVIQNYDQIAVGEYSLDEWNYVSLTLSVLLTILVDKTITTVNYPIFISIIYHFNLIFKISLFKDY